MTTEMKNIFISHVGKDDAGLFKLKDVLKSNGLSFRDYSVNSEKENNATSEQYIKGEILAPRISACSTLLVYITRDTRFSDYVNWEIEYAQKMGKHIVGIWAYGEKGCEMPEALKKYANAVVGWHGNSILDAISGKKNSLENEEGSEYPIAPITRYSC